ncbi:MAG: hypothetical protein HUU23_07610, partial [Caldilineales bacterium]|nr:hypothetical protein [Caldilineales bacterium]
MFDSTHSNSFDWRDIAADPWGDTGPTDSRGRLWLGGALFVVLLGIVFCRLVWLHYWQADEFRRIAAQPIERELPLPGIRGRILARDGSVLAVDEQLASLAVRYRWLEDPPNPAWLRQQARTRLTGAARRDPQRLKAAERDVLAERAEMHVRLAKLCEISLPEWTQRTRRIQQRVEAISRRVNERRLVKAALAAEQQRAERAQDSSSTAQLTWRERLLGDLSEALWPEQQPALPPPIVVAEELDAHVVAAELSLEAVAQIGAHSDDFPGVEIVPQWRRRYPAAALASHVLGHLGAPEKGTATANSEQLPARVGRMGIEHYYERQLRGQPGVKVEVMHRDGALVSTRRQREPTVGRDLVLSLDLALQRTAEALLDSACQRRDALSAADRPSAGGAAIVLDVHSGAVLAAASEPRFDPNLFSAATGDNTSEVAALLADPAHPLFDRTSRMALPPGSVFKPLTAIAILSHGASPQTAVSCQGYLARPDAMRCAIFTRLGHGHGEVDLFAAMAQSCNVYFFHAAAELGP